MLLYEYERGIKMAEMTKEQLNVLKDIAHGLRNPHLKAMVETVNSKKIGSNSFVSTPDKPQPPLSRTENFKNGSASVNRINAESVKLGPYISIKRIRLEPAPTGQFTKDGQEIMRDRGWYYVARTPSGEAKFTGMDDDFMSLWGAILSAYDNGWNASVNHIYDRMHNPEIKEILGGGAVFQDKKELEEAKERLKGLESGKIKSDVKDIDIKMLKERIGSTEKYLEQVSKDNGGFATLMLKQKMTGKGE
jgi:hypothetical protein